MSDPLDTTALPSESRDRSQLPCVVTGGANGLGKAAVLRLFAKGHPVAIWDRDAKQAERIAAQLNRRRANAAMYCVVDVTDGDGCARAAESVETRFKQPIFCVVNAAGVGAAQRTVSKSGRMYDLKAWRMAVDINLAGAFNVARVCARSMLKREPIDGERGVVIQVASTSAWDGQQGQTAYAAGKGGVVSMTLPMARDMADLGVRAVSICPGPMDTQMPAMLSDETRRKMVAAIPFPRRFGRPAEFAHLVQTIVDNPYLNGCSIRIDGAARMPKL